MSMGYSASQSVIIPNDKLGEVIGKSAADKLLNMLSKVDINYVDDTYVGHGFTSDNHVFTPDNYSGEVSGFTGEEIRKTFLYALDAAVTSALETIHRKTGIRAYLSYHREDDGDCYDEVQGFFIELSYSDCFAPTPAYIKLNTPGIAVIAKYVNFE